MPNHHNAQLRISFEFDLTVSDEVLDCDDATLLARLRQILGATVFDGMPTVTRKQLAKAQIALQAHRSQCDVRRLGATLIPAAAIASVAPHLTDDEIDRVARQAAAKLPETEADRPAYLRRAAMRLVNDYRLVPCQISAEQSTGGRVDIHAHLNLTNGGVLVDDAFRKVRLKSDQPPIDVSIIDAPIRLQASLGGHTLGGPLLEIPIEALVPHRKDLLERWQASADAGP